MTTITQYIQAPSKLQSVLNYCVELSDTSKEKVCLIQDIARMRRLMQLEPMSPNVFEAYYSADTLQLETLVYGLTIVLNTYMYQHRVDDKQPIQGADF